MIQRNFSMEKYWNNIAKTHEPLLAFHGETQKEWEEWHYRAKEKLMEILGGFPAKVPLNAETEYAVEDCGIVRERVVFDSEEGMSVPCYVLYPRDMSKDRTGAAIICCHGHGAFGKDAVAGIKAGAEIEREIEQCNYNYAEQLARNGFLTIAPDLRGFGERRDGIDPFPGRDACNVNFVKGAILGIYTLTLNIHDICCCIDYLETREEVDPQRIGMIGLSQGGTMTAFCAAVDERIKAACISGYVNSWEKFGIERANFCGAQIVPEIYRYFDTDEIAGLIAPRAVLLEMGIYDQCFFIQDLLKGAEGTKEIYCAAGVPERLWQDIHPGPHAYSGKVAPDFFKKYL